MKQDELEDKARSFGIDLAEIDYLTYDDAQKILLEFADWILNNMWTSVKEELPNEDGFYLCKYYDDDDGLVFYEDVMYFLSKDKLFDTIDNGRITHWMPIPKLQEGGVK